MSSSPERAAHEPHYPPLGVAVDVVVFTVADDVLQVLLTRRPSEEPFPGQWSLPGGFVGARESADEAAERELEAKAGVSEVFLEQLYTFSDPDRDPRSRVVAVAYYALVALDALDAHPGAREARRFDLATAEDGTIVAVDEHQARILLAFDHQRIIETAVERIRGKLEYAPIGFQLLPPQFTLTELQKVHEAVLGHPVDKRNFRSKIHKSGMIKELDAVRKGPHRPAKLFGFTQPTF